MHVKDFEDLDIWKLALEIIKKVYKLLESFPKEEKFSLTAQTKDSVVSIAGNIAEGFERFHYKDKIKFYYNSRGSLLETRSHLLVAEGLGFITKANKPLYEQILLDLELEARKLNNFITSVGKYQTTSDQ